MGYSPYQLEIAGFLKHHQYHSLYKFIYPCWHTKSKQWSRQISVASWVGFHFPPKINPDGTWLDGCCGICFRWCFLFWKQVGFVMLCDLGPWRAPILDMENWFCRWLSFSRGHVFSGSMLICSSSGVYFNLSPQDCFATARIKAIGSNVTCFMCHEHLSCFWMWV